MNYLITGATGLLGNNVLPMLLTEENSGKEKGDAAH